MNRFNLEEHTEQMDHFAHRAIDAEVKRFVSRVHHNDQELFFALEARGNGNKYANFCQMIDQDYRGLTCTLLHDVYCAGETTKTFELEVSFTVPETWLDAFRERFEVWIPGWILKRWKYNTKTLSKSQKYTVDALALLPGIPVRIGDRRTRFVVHERREL